MKNHWFEIAGIWLAVAVGAVMAIAFAGDVEPELAFGAILAGAVALVSLLQLFRAQPQGFVRRLVYVAGGSYLILAIATLVVELGR